MRRGGRVWRACRLPVYNVAEDKYVSRTLLTTSTPDARPSRSAAASVAIPGPGACSSYYCMCRVVISCMS